MNNTPTPNAHSSIILGKRGHDLPQRGEPSATHAQEEQPVERVELSLKSTLRHVFALGSSGSGKTVLSKVIVEEVTRLGIPAICLDPQGDLCSLALAVEEGDEATLERFGLTPELAEEFKERVEVVIFTPAARRGVPLCADPFYLDPTPLKGQDRLHAVSGVASMVTSLLGYDLSSDDGEGLSAAFDALLTEWLEAGRYPRRLSDFLSMIEALEAEERAALERFISDRKLTAALRKLARLDVGARKLLFHEGLPLNIELLLGQGDRADAQPGKVRLSVIYLNSLHSSDDRDFFIAALTEQLYGWMLMNPSPTPQALFYIDEVAPYIPPVRKTACKASLVLLFKQARKYGVSCLMATQNPGDVDYKAMAQFGTWAVGRLTTRQDLKKVQPTLKSLDPTRVDELMERLPSLQAGQFALISPDNFDESIDLQVRWLYTPHKTLDERKIEELYETRWRARFEALEAALNGDEEGQERSTVGNAHVASPQPTDVQPTAPQLDEAEELEEELEEEAESVEGAPTAEQTLLAYLDESNPLSASELGAQLELSPAKVRQLAKKLEEQGLVGRFKEGRSQRYFSLRSGARPDLGLGRRVEALCPQLTEGEVLTRLEDQRTKKTLGMFGDEERLLSHELCYRALYRVCFSEQVADGVLESWFGGKSKRVEDSIYLEPKTLKVLVYQTNSSITLEDRPGTDASAIPDFDGVSRFEQLAPTHVNLEEEAWQARRSEEEVRASVLERFGVEITTITPLLLPLWRARYQPEGSHQVRVLYLDALSGQPVTF